MDAPKFVRCPECDEKYNDGKKRRIIDSCGHPRCYSCLFIDNPCLVCEELLRRRSKSWLNSRESLLSTDEDRDAFKGAAPHGFVSKEHYLRTLYSYDPGSEENVSHFKVNKSSSTQRSLLDVNDLTEKRRNNLGRHSNSALVLSTSPLKPSLRKGTSRESISDDTKRFSFPSSFKDLVLSRESSTSLQNLSPSSGLMRSINEIIENNLESLKPNGRDRNDSGLQSEETSPRSSGYWSEMESLSDQEAGKNSSRHDSLSSNNTTSLDMKELAKIDDVLSGKSAAWENTKALFRPTSLSLFRGNLDMRECKDKESRKSSIQTRRHSAPDWHFRKFLEMRIKHNNTANTE